MQAGRPHCGLPVSELLGERIHFQIALRRNAEGVSNPIEKRKHGRDVYRLCDLRLAPADIAQFLNILRRGTVGRFRYVFHVIKQYSLGLGQAGIIKIALSDSLYCLFLCSLDTQEVSMRVQSIRASVEI